MRELFIQTREDLSKIAGGNLRLIRWLESLQANVSELPGDLNEIETNIATLQASVTILQDQVNTILIQIELLEEAIGEIESDIEGLETTGGGVVTLDFGAFPGSNEAEIAFADTSIRTETRLQPYFSASDSTADHTESDHRYAGLFVTLTAEAENEVGGTIYARSPEKMQGTFKARYERTG